MIKNAFVFISIAITVWISWAVLEWLIYGTVQVKKSDTAIAWILTESLYLNYQLFKMDGEQE